MKRRRDMLKCFFGFHCPTVEMVWLINGTGHSVCHCCHVPLKSDGQSLWSVDHCAVRQHRLMCDVIDALSRLDTAQLKEAGDLVESLKRLREAESPELSDCLKLFVPKNSHQSEEDHEKT